MTRSYFCRHRHFHCDCRCCNYYFIIIIFIHSFGKRLHGGVPREKPCAYPFDGPGGIIAHAYYPSRGFIHFDDDEHFTELGGVQGWWWNSRQSRSLLYTAVHEIGHALGLAHSNVQGAVMWPLARNGRPVLHQDDIDGINSLYGRYTQNWNSLCVLA